MASPPSLPSTPAAPARPTAPPPPPPEAEIPPPPPEAIEVECNLTQMVGHIQLVEVHGDDVLGPVAVTAVRDWIRFTPRRAAGVGWLYAEGHLPSPVAWIDGACLEQVELLEPPTGGVHATLEGLVPGVDYTMSSTRRAKRFDSTATEVTLDLAADRAHEVRIMASFGVEWITGDAAQVQPIEDQVVEVSLVAPDIPPLGWSLQPVDGAWKVAAVLPDSSAHRAELEIGDRILTIDGEPVEELDKDALLWADEPVEITFLPYGADPDEEPVRATLDPP